MRNSPWYLLFLLVFIGVVAGSVYVGSEVRVLSVEGKHSEDARGRRGSSTTRLVIETDQGDFPILTFPLIGYSVGAEDVYRNIRTGATIEVRVGKWPPEILGADGRWYIMALR